MYIRASSAHGLDNSPIMEFHIAWNFVTSILQILSPLEVKYSLNARPPDLECHKLSKFWSQSYVIIAYIINFQVQSTPGQIQIKFTLYIFGIHL